MAIDEREPTIRVAMMPKDTNAWGTIFGGVILSHLDTAGAVEARKHGCRRYVTKVMREVDFLAPVMVGDVVSFYTSTLELGRTSLIVKIDVYAQRLSDCGVEPVKVTAAEIVYVAVDEKGQPVPVSS